MNIPPGPLDIMTQDQSWCRYCKYLVPNHHPDCIHHGAKERTVLKTVGIGKCPQLGGTTLAELEDELAKLRAKGAPDDARVFGTAPGSVYLLESSWVGKVSK